MLVGLRLFAELQSTRPRRKGLTFFAGSNTLGFEGFELGAGLLAVADRVVDAERYLLAAGKQKILAALHEILLIEGPGVHEVLKHNHDHVFGNIANSKALGQAARLARQRQLISGFRRARY